MFKIAKYYFLLHMLHKAKKNIIALVISVGLLIVAKYIFSDFIAVAESKGVLIMAKWAVFLPLLVGIAFNLVQIFKIFRMPFFKDGSSKKVDLRKDRILSKEHLVSKNDQIVNKYRNKS